MYIDDQTIRDVSEDVLRRYRQDATGSVYHAVYQVLMERFGASASRVNGDGVLDGGLHVDEQFYVIHRMASTARTSMVELNNARNPQGTLWQLQQKVGDAKFELLKLLIEKGEQTISPIRGEVMIVLSVDTVSLEVGEVPPKEPGQYVYHTKTLMENEVR